jgi:hypothetical protein
VTRVFIDPGATVIESGGAVDPEAIRSLRFLLESGHEVVVVDAGREPPAELAQVAASSVPAIPAQPDRAGWYLTNDVERCRGTSARIRTVLIGAAPPSGSVRRCDSVARDVQAAVMEILASEAMTSPP